MEEEKEITWLSCYIYDDVSLDSLLAGKVRPLVDEVLQKGWAKQFFFIRYLDRKGKHVRLRFKGEQQIFESMLEPLLQKTFIEIRFVSYRPEVARYGGHVGVVTAEQLFEASSAVVLSFLDEQHGVSYGKSLGFALQMNVGTAHALGMSKAEVINFFSQLAVGVDTAEAKCYFAEQREALAPALINMWHRLDAGLAFDKPWFNAYLKKVWETRKVIQRTYDTGELHPPVPTHSYQAHPLWLIYASYMHMNNNRNGINFMNESYLAYVISKSLATI
ncbi:MAG TPA: thiopeptide-type bacteriocin biosynthesis protein [Candidatus Saccharimonadales bacterium]|jgi:thiopeptide-type bacteriocin biosynthesis protein